MKAKLIILGTFLFSVPLRLNAGPVSLEPDEILQLRALVAANPAVAKQFSSIHRWADSALSASPNPIDKIVAEGHLANDPLAIRSRTSRADLGKIEVLAWAWAVTGDVRYSSKAQEFILAWAKMNISDGNAINETQFEPLIIGYDLLRGTFSEATRRQVDGWLRNKAIVLWNNPRGSDGNFFSHKLKIIGLIGWTIGDPALVAETLDGFHRQINSNLKPDGTSTDFIGRDALHYHLYTIEPLLTYTMAAERAGQQLFDYTAANGAMLKSGVDFVVPFATGAKTHMEFANSKVAFDKKRAQNGQAEYQHHLWEPKAATKMFSQAAWFRPEYGVLAAKLAEHPGEKFFSWQMVINAVSHHASVPPAKQ